MGSVHNDPKLFAALTSLSLVTRNMLVAVTHVLHTLCCRASASTQGEYVSPAGAQVGSLSSAGVQVGSPAPGAVLILVASLLALLLPQLQLDSSYLARSTTSLAATSTCSWIMAYCPDQQCMSVLADIHTMLLWKLSVITLKTEATAAVDLARKRLSRHTTFDCLSQVILASVGGKSSTAGGLMHEGLLS